MKNLNRCWQPSYRLPKTTKTKYFVELWIESFGKVWGFKGIKLSSDETFIRYKFNNPNNIASFCWDMDRGRMHMHGVNHLSHKPFRAARDWFMYKDENESLGKLRKTRVNYRHTRPNYSGIEWRK